MRITLQPGNPYRTHAIAALGNRPSAIRSFMGGDELPYRQWFRSQCATRGWDVKQEDLVIQDLHRLVDMVTAGQNPNDTSSGWAVRRDSRLDGPMSCRIHADGYIEIWDGNHRACILEVLGRPFDLEVLSIDPRANELFAKRHLYQDSPHPILSAHPSWRVNTAARYAAIANWIGPSSVVEIGCAEGTGLEMISRTATVAIGYEQDRIARTLATGLNRGVVVRDDATPENLLSADVLVLESVLHHLTKTPGLFRRWIDRVSKFERIVLELPGNEGPWNDYHKGCDDPQGRLMSALAKTHPNKVELFRDPAYFDRITWGLSHG